MNKAAGCILNKLGQGTYAGVGCGKQDQRKANRFTHFSLRGKPAGSPNSTTLMSSNT